VPPSVDRRPVLERLRVVPGEDDVRVLRMDGDRVRVVDLGVMEESPPVAAVFALEQTESVLAGVDDVRVGWGRGQRVDRAELELVPGGRPRRSVVLRAIDLGCVDDLIDDRRADRVNDELVNPRVGESAAVQPRPRIPAVGRAIRPAPVGVGGVDCVRVDRIGGEEADSGAKHSLALEGPRCSTVPAGGNAVDDGDVEPVRIVRVDVHPADVARSPAAERLNQRERTPCASPIGRLVDLVCVVHVQRTAGPLGERPPTVVGVESSPERVPRLAAVAGDPRVADALRSALVVDVVEADEDQVWIVISDEHLPHAGVRDSMKQRQVPGPPAVDRVVEAVRFAASGCNPVRRRPADGHRHDLALRQVPGGVAPGPSAVTAGVERPPFRLGEEDLPVDAVVDPGDPALVGDGDPVPRDAPIGGVQQPEVAVGREDAVRRRVDVGDPLPDSGIRDVPRVTAVGASVDPRLFDRRVDDLGVLNVDGDAADRSAGRSGGLLPSTPATWDRSRCRTE
jgi:hypothetical protein